MVKTRSASQQRPNSTARTPPSSRVTETDGHRDGGLTPPSDSRALADLDSLVSGQPGMLSSQPSRPASRQDQVNAIVKRWHRGQELRSLPLEQLNARQKTRRIRGLRNAKRDSKVTKTAKGPLSSSSTTTSPISSRRIRGTQQRLIEIERQEREDLIEKYKITGDPHIFCPFLRPFMRSTKLSEWRWDTEVERWWREDRSTGERLWEPLDEFFI